MTLTKMEESNDMTDMEGWQKLAREGHLEYKLKLGKHFLVQADSGDEESKSKNGKTAISWLIEASKQGSEEATKLLKKCVQTGTGRDDTNKDDMDWCISTPALEKRIRFAATKLYKKFNDKKGNISRDEFRRAVKRTTANKSLEQRILIAAGNEIGDEISETDFVKTVTHEIQGQLTLTTSEESQNTKEYEQASIVEKVTKFPKSTAMSLLNVGFESVSTEGVSWIVSMIPTNQIYLLALFFLYGVITTKLLFRVVPLLVFYVAILVLGTTTFQMIYKKKSHEGSTSLANMLKIYHKEIDIDKVRSQLTWNSLTPYFIYFGIIPILVISFSLSPKKLIPCSELCVFSGGISLVCLYVLCNLRDPVTLVTVASTTMSSLPLLVKKLPKIPLISRLIQFTLKPFTVIHCGGGFTINLGLPAIAYFCLVLSFILLARRRSWSGIYTTLVPHLVFYFWFSLMTMFFSSATWNGLIRASIEYLFLPVVIPFALIALFLGLLYVAYVLFRTELFGKLILTVLLASVPLLLSQTKLLLGNTIDNKYLGVKKIIMITFAVLALVPLVSIRIPTVEEPGEFKMSFEDYVFMCGDGLRNIAPTQKRCSHVVGQEVTWKGSLHSAKITNTENTVEPLLTAFPSFIANQLRCFYGQEFGDCDAITDEAEKKLCRTMKSLGNHCHLKNRDTYSFQIIVFPENSNSSIKLEIGNEFKDLVFALGKGDQLVFTGTIGNGIGTEMLSLNVNNLTCTSRELRRPSATDDSDDEFDEKLAKKFKRVIRHVTRFFWYPLLDYKLKP